MVADLRRIFGTLRQAVQETAPYTWPDRNFSSAPNSLLQQPQEWIQSQSRTFRDFCFRVVGYPLSDQAYCYYSLDVELYIFYPHSVATDELQMLKVEDAVAVQNAIGRHPETWGGADSISFLGQQPYEWETLTDDNGEPIASVLAIPFRIEVKNNG